MEFSFKVTESEFRQGWKLERRASSRSSLKTAIFWILIMLGLLLLYRFIAQSSAALRLADVPLAVVQPVVNEAPEPTTLARLGPFLVIAGIWFLIVGAMVPMRLRHLYKKDPRMQGQFSVNVSPEGIETKNTAGTLSKSSWNVYDSWSEGKEIIVLTFHSGSYSLLSLAGLAETQRSELRQILASALKKK